MNPRTGNSLTTAQNPTNSHPDFGYLHSQASTQIDCESKDYWICYC